MFDLKEKMQRQQEEVLYSAATPIAQDHPSGIVTLIRELCSRNGIAQPPELRSMPYIGQGGLAIASKNCLVLNEDSLNSTPKDEIEGLSAHEIAHIVFGDQGMMIKKQEHRADRFSHFLTGNPGGLAKNLTKAHIPLEDEAAILRKKGWTGKLAMWLREKRERKMYGSFPERLANLTRPLSSQEISEFKEAIALYNKKMGIVLAPKAEITTVTTSAPPAPHVLDAARKIAFSIPVVEPPEKGGKGPPVDRTRQTER